MAVQFFKEKRITKEISLGLPPNYQASRDLVCQLF